MKHILMVDDVTTNLKCAAEVLQPYYQLSMAKSGKQALQFLKKNRPDLILLDIAMPDMDGYQTMEEIKLNPLTADIPIIFLTADTELSSEIKGIKMGAMDFITKPFEAEVMLGRIEKVLQMEDMRKNIFASAQQDELTGIWNIECLQQNVDQYLHGVGNEATLVLIDLDDFCKYSETIGVDRANDYRRNFVESLKAFATSDELLRGESLENKCWFGRTGDNEFALLIKKDYPREELVNLCERMQKSLLRDVTFSTVITKAPVDGASFSVLYENGEKAMYFMKQSGKNGYHIFHNRNRG